MPPGPYACVDIGSNTTRLLVAEAADGRLIEVLQRRSFTRLGRDIRRDGAIPADTLAAVADVVAAQVDAARQLGAREVRAVATAAIRSASNGAELLDAVRERSGVQPAILTGEEEARLAFLGATRTLEHPVPGDVAVADVGGGSCELALGSIGEGMRWSRSLPVGSGDLADRYLLSDPPSVDELGAAREHAASAFAGLELERPRLAVAVGGSATSLRRLVGAQLGRESLERGLRLLASTPLAEVARRFELEPERVRLLPAGMLILQEISDRLGRPLQIGRGGLREGAILELAARDGAGVL